MLLRTLFMFYALLLLAGCHSGITPKEGGELLTYEELMAERVAFGRDLFTDKRLSLDSSIACIDCHQPEKAFTDGLPLSRGVRGGVSFRNAPSLLNVRDFQHFMFDAQIPTLEMQAQVPIQDTNEMAVTMKELVNRLRNDSIYRAKATFLYGRTLNAWVITRALSDFERSLVSVNSRFDQYLHTGSSQLLDADERAGWKLFSGKAQCIQCHQLPHFTSETARNNGFGSTDPIDPGRFRVTGKASDYGRFKVPSLRNIELTAPYMHNGQMETLESVLDFYGSDKQALRNTDPLAQNIRLSQEEKTQLIAFLKTLTDTSYLRGWKNKIE